MKLVKLIGQPVCLALYGVSAYLAAKKKPLSLIALFLCHLSEYFIIGQKTGREKNIKPAAALFNCLAFGFTWWLPLKKGK